MKNNKGLKIAEIAILLIIALFIGKVFLSIALYCAGGGCPTYPLNPSIYSGNPSYQQTGEWLTQVNQNATINQFIISNGAFLTYTYNTSYSCTQGVCSTQHISPVTTSSYCQVSYAVAFPSNLANASEDKLAITLNNNTLENAINSGLFVIVNSTWNINHGIVVAAGTQLFNGCPSTFKADLNSANEYIASHSSVTTTIPTNTTQVINQTQTPPPTPPQFSIFTLLNNLIHTIQSFIENIFRL